MSEYERPDRLRREPTIADIHELVGAATPHFALQIRNRIRNLIVGLPDDHPVRQEGERWIAHLEEVARGAEARGPVVPGERGLKSYVGDRV
ncbi:hypothetical protein JDY09_07615 [Thermoleophilum album]|uniref:hypothetical protein n=1 Tax=Thermoleophilum album TaxID=29539 RepID=UPI00237D2637|nr:hypothetical protein [Thermoleophilum album]WDT93250.1 hypothetical protein JDY09_07615 [Thermoleophilum album]